MIVKKLQVRSYRNAESRDVEFKDGINAFVGANARGKTNLLEAVYFAGVGKSFRTPRDRELIKSDCERAEFSVMVEKQTCIETVRIILDRKTNKRVAVNGIPISRMSELMGVCPVVLFCPDGLKIVKEAPSDRRRFMDISLCQISKAYFAALMRYDKILQSRNRLLKSDGANRNTLAPWNELLAEEGAKIVKSRRGFLKRISVFAKEKNSYMTEGTEELTLAYEGAEGESFEEIKSQLLKGIESDYESDMRLRYTHTGPHKDDIKIALNGIDVRSFGSQGQQRTVALSLKLAEIELLEQTLGTSPVLLLDDVFSELDGKRRKKLLSALNGFQTIITSTDDEEFEEFGVNVIRI